MNLNKKLTLILVLISFQFTFAAPVQVRILTTKVISSFIFSPLSGNYFLYGDNKLITESDASGIFQMSIDGDSILLKTFERTIGKFSTLKMSAQGSDAAFKIKSVIPASKVRTYDDHLSVSLSTDKKQFLLINKADLEDYIAGVVESEAGTKSAVEYYKLQALLCRTYLLAHINRHQNEGFQVCDDVHCQAYLSRTMDSEIKEGVLNTKGLVVVDADLNLITAAFHSNCGGQTVNSQDVWAMSKSYLKTVMDTFCLHQTHATWKRSIPLEDWKAYLQLKHKYPVDDSLKFIGATSFTQPNGRAIYFLDKDMKIPLKIIRADFQLKSTYFSVEQKGDSVNFVGRGYGHGVGLCQEGAMRMAKLNYSYKDILHYYYKDVNLVDLSALNYFQKE
ncbi:MAG: SpoIID/LytB domain-containing protein [Bacteroidota bacterium]|nr:SpoIID/LytB domain-containing protein [Bacteroidota bacterium]